MDDKGEKGQGDGGAAADQGVNQGHGPGVGEVAEKDAGQAKEGGVEQADPAVQLEAVVGVVPPAHVEQALHDAAGDVLHGTGEEQAEEEGEDGAGAAAAEGAEDQKGAVAVDGAEEAVEKTPLLAELVLADGAVDSLAAPADEAVENEEEKPARKGGEAA